jgi:hypothetical protein
VERKLALGVAHARSQVLPVHGVELPPSDQAQPEIERRVWLLHVLGQGRCILDKGLLENVGWVEPALEAMVDSQANHPPQTIRMSVEQLAHGCRFGGAGAFQQLTEIAPRSLISLFSAVPRPYLVAEL